MSFHLNAHRLLVGTSLKVGVGFYRTIYSCEMELLLGYGVGLNGHALFNMHITVENI